MAKLSFQLVNAGAESFRDNNGVMPSWESLFFALRSSEKSEDVELLEEALKWEKFSSIVNSNPSMKDLFTLTMSSTCHDMELFERVLAGRNLLTFINQAAKDTGSTLLHAACQVESPRKAFLLLQAGAQLQADNEGEMPKVEKLFKGWDFTWELHDLKTDREALFSKLVLTVGPSGWPLGIQHVVESPHLLQLLRSWDAVVGAMKEKAERRVLEAFGRNLQMTSTSFPLSMGGEEREGMEEIIRKWNSKHNAKCEFLPPIFAKCSSKS